MTTREVIRLTGMLLQELCEDLPERAKGSDLRHISYRARWDYRPLCGAPQHEGDWTFTLEGLLADTDKVEQEAHVLCPECIARLRDAADVMVAFGTEGAVKAEQEAESRDAEFRSRFGDRGLFCTYAPSITDKGGE